jgi:hypothetical protein
MLSWLLLAQLSFLQIPAIEIPHSFRHADLGCQTLAIDQVVSLTWAQLPPGHTITVDAVFPADQIQRFRHEAFHLLITRPTAPPLLRELPATQGASKFTAAAAGEHCFVVNAVGRFTYAPIPRLEGPLQTWAPRVFAEGWQEVTWPRSVNTIDGYRLYVSSDPAFLGNPMVIAREVLNSLAPSARFYVARSNVTWHLALTEVILNTQALPPTGPPRLRKLDEAPR